MKEAKYSEPSSKIDHRTKVGGLNCDLLLGTVLIRGFEMDL